VCRIFLETKNWLFDACDTDTCHIKALSILEKKSLNILKTLKNMATLYKAALHDNDFVTNVASKTNNVVP
jgi:hypothetical protein